MTRDAEKLREAVSWVVHDDEVGEPTDGAAIIRALTTELGITPEMVEELRAWEREFSRPDLYLMEGEAMNFLANLSAIDLKRTADALALMLEAGGTE